MAHDVFVCYASGDKTAADAVVAILEQDGIRCWVSPRDVLPGRTYGQAIVEALHGARVVVVLLSSHANESPTVNRELERAVNDGLPILPVRLEEVTPTGQLTYFLSDAHWLDAITPPLEQHIHQLADTVRLLLDQEQPSAPVSAPLPPPPPPPGPPPPAERRGLAALPGWQLALIAGIGVALVGVILALLLRGGEDDGAGEAGDDEASVTSANEEPDTGGGEPTTMDLLDVGDCYSYLEGGLVAVGDCDESHDGEVVGDLPYPGGADAPYPGMSELDDFASTECEAVITEATGRSTIELGAELGIAWFGIGPTEQEWAVGDRSVTCMIEATTGGSSLEESLITT